MSVSGLGRAHRIDARDIAMRAATLGLRHSERIHYTQGSARWWGIAHHDRALHGEYPLYADCSSFVTWCLWNALTHFGIDDIVNGAHWRAGYTGTLLNHGKRVWRRFQRGDLVIYGNGFPGHHVAIYIGGSMVISHGSERGPLKCSMYYRSDLMQVRRYI